MKLFGPIRLLTVSGQIRLYVVGGHVSMIFVDSCMNDV